MLENNLHEIWKKMFGKKMTKEQLETLEALRKLVKEGKISVEDAKRIWNNKYHVWD